jgi:hypothetical protein
VQRYSVIKRCLNTAQHPINIGQNIVVPETQHTIAARLEKVSSYRIGVCLRRLPMLPAVQFDDKAKLMTGEIGVVRPDRRLSAKMRTRGSESA